MSTGCKQLGKACFLSWEHAFFHLDAPGDLFWKRQNKSHVLKCLIYEDVDTRTIEFPQRPRIRSEKNFISVQSLLSLSSHICVKCPQYFAKLIHQNLKPKTKNYFHYWKYFIKVPRKIRLSSAYKIKVQFSGKIYNL